MTCVGFKYTGIGLRRVVYGLCECYKRCYIGRPPVHAGRDSVRGGYMQWVGGLIGRVRVVVVQGIMLDYIHISAVRG